MNVHKNARLTPQGRALLVHRIRTAGWRVADAAAAGISERTAFRWLARHRAGGEFALQDRSSAPARCPHRTSADTVTAVERLRRQRLTGPQIARQLGVPRSTVGAILRRCGLGRLSALAPKPDVIRYQRDHPGELIHLDIKKLGRIDGVGHRITGDRTGQSSKRGTGWEYLHVAIDDASRLAYSEILPNERKESAIAFTRRARAWFARFGITIERIMTDNGAAYKSFAYRDLLAGLAIKHKPAVYATHQRQSRALHPDQPARMGLCQCLSQFGCTHRGSVTVAGRLQHNSQSQRSSRPATFRLADQPTWLRHLV
jgi:hypothetical protein